MEASAKKAMARIPGWKLARVKSLSSGRDRRATGMTDSRHACHVRARTAGGSSDQSRRPRKSSSFRTALAVEERSSRTTVVAVRWETPGQPGERPAVMPGGGVVGPHADRGPPRSQYSRVAGQPPEPIKIIARSRTACCDAPSMIPNSPSAVASAAGATIRSGEASRARPVRRVAPWRNRR